MRKRTIKNAAFPLFFAGIFYFWNHFFLAAEEIHEVAFQGNLEEMSEILKKDPGLLNRPDQNGRTPLHLASLNKQNQVARFLIEQGAKLDLKDENKNTPLHNAALTGNLELVKILLEKGSKSIKEGASWNNTPLHLACEQGQPDVVAYLLEKGAYLEALSAMKRTPLIAAARERGDIGVIKILVERGADIHARDISGDTALTLAAWRGFEDVVNFLIEKKSKIPEDKMWPALWMAAENNLKHLYDYLLENRLKPEVVKDTHQTLIHYAAAGGSVEIVASLIAKGFDPGCPDKDGWTTLHYAASQGRDKMIEYLVTRGVNKNSRNKKGETAYHLAVFREFPETAEKLQKMGVDSQAPKFPELKGLYMGQNPPGEQPKLFLPGIVSGHYNHHSTIVFSPDGKEACWSEMYPPREKGYASSGVMLMKMVDDKWTCPVMSAAMKGEPFYAPDGKRLYFISNNPLPGQKQGGKENIWYMEKTDTGWQKPSPVAHAVNSMQLHWQFSLDRRGNLYFADWNRIYVAESENGKLKKPVDISEFFDNPGLKGFCPFISPDGDYLIFSASRGDNERIIDLFISFRKKDGTWTDKINLGESVNGTDRNIGAFVSQDGKYLFFTSAGENRPWGIYWVEAGIIEKLRPKNLN